VRGKSSVVLLALAVAALAPSLGVAQYTPQWQVGDWWVTKTWHKSASGEWVWDRVRYDIVGVEKVGERDCFVLETRHQGTSGRLSSHTIVHYVRIDDRLVVRQVMTYTYKDKSRADTLDRPLGMFGPFRRGEARLPRFPLQPANDTDTVFRLKQRDDCVALLREIPGVADSAMVRRLLADGDSDGERAVRPTGVVYQVREEMGGNLEPGPLPGEKLITQSLQFWCDGQPWRLYEELVGYHGQDLKRFVVERTWLVASGHKG
jgi:hypothetical protein